MGSFKLMSIILLIDSDSGNSLDKFRMRLRIFGLEGLLCWQCMNLFVNLFQ